MNTTAAEVRGPQPKVHPSAAGPNSGRMDVNAGTIETADGRRVLRAGGEFVTGLLAGLDAEVGDAAGVELRCAAAGADRCQFLVSTARRTGQAAAWRNEGAATDDILHRLSHPEAGR